MSDHKTCPKCDSEDFVATAFGLTRGRQIGLTTGLVKKVAPAVYVCCDCGFLEMWVDCKDDLNEIRNYYLDKSKDRQAERVKVEV